MKDYPKVPDIIVSPETLAWHAATMVQLLQKLQYIDADLREMRSAMIGICDQLAQLSQKKEQPLSDLATLIEQKLDEIRNLQFNPAEVEKIVKKLLKSSVHLDGRHEQDKPAPPRLGPLLKEMREAEENTESQNQL